MHLEVRQNIDRIDYQIARYRKSEIDDETLSAVSKLLCVRCCGALEQGVRTILTSYARAVSGDKFTKAMSKLCQNFQNPKPEKITTFFKEIDVNFEVYLRSEWAEAEKGAIGSIVAQRIKICHGLDSNITLSQVEEYFKHCKIFLERLNKYYLE